MLVVAVIAAALLSAGCGEKDEAAIEPGAGATTNGAESDLSPVRRQFEAELRRTLPDQQKLRGAQIDCVLERLRETVTDEQLEDVASPNVSREVARASVACSAVAP